MEVFTIMNLKKSFSILMASCLLISNIGVASAIDIDTAGGTGSVPVKLTAEALTFSVTVPMALPVNVDASGTVTVATDAKITNNSAGPVKVEGVSVEATSPWTLTEYTDLSGEKVGTKKFGLQIQDTNVSTNGSCAATFDSIPAKNGATPGSIDLTYNAKVAPQKEAVSGVGIASVVFTVGWDEEAPIVYQDFEVTASNSGKVGFTGTAGENLVIPSTLEDGGINYKVTSIGNNAFGYKTSLTSVALPDSLTSIGNSAFYNCTSLTSINISNSVTSIGNRAFYGCSSLASITIPDGVTSIEQETFYNCTSLTSITIPNSVNSIGENAFSYFYNSGNKPISSLTSITYNNHTYNSVDEFKTAFNAIPGNAMA